MLIKIKPAYAVVLAVVVALISNNIAKAVDINYYRQNDVLFYDPSSSAVCSSNSTVTGSNNLDYSGKAILTSAELAALQANMSVYKTAADANGIPWQLLAAVHYRENNFKTNGPANGQGPFQDTTQTYPTGTYTTQQFQDAANKAAASLKQTSGGRDLSSVDSIKFTLFAYNGQAGVYKTQAVNLGFTADQANIGEGSPYVMNRADMKRDPTVEPTKSNNTWGQIKSDGGKIVYPANDDYGAFIVYASLSGISASGDCSSGSLVSGGMTLAQAKEFMRAYRTNSDSINYIGGASRGCSGGPLANCVSFSVYFINKYTSLAGFGAGQATGNGIDVVNNIINRNPSAVRGTAPQPYAIFSRPSSTPAGHTGVILGVDDKNGKVIIGEAGCGEPLSWADAREYPLADYNGTNVQYAYTTGLLKGL